ncbi:hypothetical protein AB0N88_04985 [Streptomyces sp. NPDC093516]|uniref:hypothetical protein n=1 Tax=Streptomyces sp. NPDC093516 TaxID=3155304 RepID=UPI003419D2A8
MVHAGSEPPGWLIELANRMAPARSSEAAVLVGAPLPENGADGLCQLLAPAMVAIRNAHVRLMTLVMSAGAHDPGNRPSVARMICERWGLDVLAPAGSALITAHGTLFSPDLPGASGGWWHFAPGAEARRVSSHVPVPDWEHAMRQVGRQTVAGHVVEAVPAGLSVRPAGPAPLAVYGSLHAVPPQPDKPRLIVSSPHVPAAVLAVVLASLPEWVCESVVLESLNGQPLLRTGQAVADLLGRDVRVAMGARAAMGRGVLADDAAVTIGGSGPAGTATRVIVAGDGIRRAVALGDDPTESV